MRANTSLLKASLHQQGASVMKTFRTTLAALIFGLAISGLAYAADKAFPSGMDALTTPAANDYLLISDTSASAASVKITYADLFDSPPNNGIALGGASNGFTSAYFTNGTATGAVVYDSNVLTIGSTSAHSINLRSNNKYITFNATSGALYPASATQALGSDGTTNAWNAAYFTNGTATGAIKFDTYLQMGTTSAHSWQLIRGGTPVLNITASTFYPVSSGFSLGLDDVNSFIATYWGDGSAVKARAIIGSSVFSIGTYTDHAVAIRQNGSASITLDTDGRPIFAALASAIADGGLANSQISFYLDETGGAEKLVVKAKLSGGTVKTFTIAAD